MELEHTEYGREGSFFCKPANAEIDLLVPDDEVSEEYIERCIASVNGMTDRLMSEICSAAKRYCLKMKALCSEAGEDFADVAAFPVDENTPPEDMPKYFSITGMVIEEPEDDSIIGYQLSCNCDWEHEHGMEIDILGDKLVYLGMYEDNSPWFDYEESEWNFA